MEYNVSNNREMIADKYWQEKVQERVKREGEKTRIQVNELVALKEWESNMPEWKQVTSSVDFRTETSDFAKSYFEFITFYNDGGV